MCGILGIFGNIDINDYIKINNEIKLLQINRGPNGFNSRVYNNCILAHNRLKIIDLSDNGMQPMENDNLSLVFNGEIYNYNELKLNYLSDIKFNSSSDTEVLLNMFDKYGIEETLKKISGMYAIALYNKKTNKLYLIRDRMGEKPLYYYIENKKIYFASNLKSIFYSLYKIKNKKWYLNYESIYKYLLLGGCWEGETIIKNIFKLEKSHYLEINSNFDINKKKYWKPNLNNSNFIDNIRNSVNLMNNADVPLSILFSGGIDSSVVLYYSKNGSNCIHLKNGESEYAKIISNKLNGKIDIRNCENENIDVNKLLDYLKKYIDFAGEPSMACIIVMLTLDGVKNKSTVVLTGNGGDELCYGYTRTPILDSNNNKNDIDNNNIIHNRLIPNKNIIKSNENHQILHIFRHPSIVSVKNVKQYTLDELKNMIYSDIEIDSNLHKEAFYRFLEFNTFVSNDLNPTLDYASMFYSLETRSPFLDHNVIESGLSLESRHHISSKKYNNWEFSRKKYLKDILSNKLDENLYNRNKLGFSLPQNLHAAYNIVTGSSSLQKLVNRGIIEIKDLNIGNAGRDKSYLYASCTALEEWFVQYVDTNIINI